MILIGIDPGTQTGLARWSTAPQQLQRVECLTILQAMRVVELEACQRAPDLFVIFEDARKRKWYGKMDAEQKKYGAGVREGVGYVKRDCAIWEEFLRGLGVAFEMRYPSATKMKAEPFARLTGWTGRTNEHARDAAMIVFGLNDSIARAKVIAFRDGHSAAQRQDHHRRGAGPTVRHGNGPV